MSQQGDVKLFQTTDDGDIYVVNGIVEMSGGLETSAYLSLFGGNEDDDGSDGSPFSWWANLRRTGHSGPVPKRDTEPTTIDTGYI